MAKNQELADYTTGQYNGQIIYIHMHIIQLFLASGLLYVCLVMRYCIHKN